MKQWKAILQSTRQQGRRFAIKSGLSAALVLIAVMLLATAAVGHAHAASRSQTYRIVYGDTLSRIAQRYGVSVATLATVNHIANPNLIYAGTTIIIPGSDSGSQIAPAVHQNQPQPQPRQQPQPQVSGSYTNMIYQVFGPYGNGAVRVAMCESGLNPRAYNGVLGAAGLFQIIPGTFASTSYAGQSVYNPITNIRAAHEIFVRDGYSWREWACKP